MKKMIGLMAIALAFALAFTACDNGGGGGGDDNGGGGGGSGPTFLGETMSLSGQVYKMTETETGMSYQKYNGNLGVATEGGLHHEEYGEIGIWAGEIKNGQLSLSFPEAPTYLKPLDEAFYLEEDFDNVQISSQNVKVFLFDSLAVFSEGGGGNYYPVDDTQLVRGNFTYRESGNSYSGIEEYGVYVYVDGNVTLSGKGKTEIDSDTYGGTTYTDTFTSKNFSLALKKGWNTVHFKWEFSGTKTGNTDNSKTTCTLSLSNPNSCRWILMEGESADPDDYYSVMLPQGQRSLSVAPAAGKSRLKAFNRARQE